jgi:hypothetical protein
MEKIIIYNPRNGGEINDVFAQTNTNMKSIPLRNMMLLWVNICLKSMAF